MKSKLLPAYCIPKRSLNTVGGVIVHHFSTIYVDPEEPFDMDKCRQLFFDLNRERSARQVYMRDQQWPEERQYASGHFLIGREGEIWRLVEPDQQAYHAGVSLLDGRNNCNAWTIGIELIGTAVSGFSRDQYGALARLCLDLEHQHGFSRSMIQGHDTVRYNALMAGAKARTKNDPSGESTGRGDNFDWYYLGKLMNDIKPNPEGVNDVSDLDQVLAADPNSN